MISKAHKRIKEEKNIESCDSSFTALLSRSGKHSVTFLEAGTGQTQPNSGVAHEEGEINAVENAAGITDLEKPSELQASKDTLQITKILDEFVSKKRIANAFSFGIPDFPGSKPTNQYVTPGIGVAPQAASAASTQSAMAGQKSSSLNGEAVGEHCTCNKPTT